MFRYEAEAIDDWYELVDAANAEDFELVDYGYIICNESSFDEWVNDHLVDWARELNWYDLYEKLQEIPQTVDYRHAIKVDGDEYEELDEDEFEYQKRCFIEYMDENDYWEYEDVEDDAPSFSGEGVDYLREDKPIINEEVKDNIEKKFFTLLEF